MADFVILKNGVAEGVATDSHDTSYECNVGIIKSAVFLSSLSFL